MVATSATRAGADDADSPENAEEVPKLELKYKSCVHNDAPLR